MRLHKALAAAGVASRRMSEALITEGHVTVDGIMVTKLGVVVDPEAQDIRFDGQKIACEASVYYVVNKPAGYLCTNLDEFGRKTVISLIRDRKKRRLYTVGRLDEDSEGLILVTNDGDFANKVAHPRFGVDKTYHLRLRGFLENDELDKARKGVWLSDGKTGSMYVRVLKRSKQMTSVKCVVDEGRNRQLRRIFAKLGHPVLKLQRVRIGQVGLDSLKRGSYRRLSPDDVKSLIEATDVKRADKGSDPKSKRPTTRRRQSRGNDRSNERSRSRRPPRR